MVEIIKNNKQLWRIMLFCIIVLLGITVLLLLLRIRNQKIKKEAERRKRIRERQNQSRQIVPDRFKDMKLRDKKYIKNQR